MSKLFVATLVFSTVSLAIAAPVPSLSLFASNPGVQGPLSGLGNEDLLNALAALQKPVTVAKVKEVYKVHAPAVYRAIEAAEAAFAKVLNAPGILPKGASKAIEFLQQVGEQVEKHVVVGYEVDEEAKEAVRLLKVFKAFGAGTQKVIGEKFQKLAEAVTKAFVEALGRQVGK